MIDERIMQALFLVAVLTVAVNIITEVLKKCFVFPDKTINFFVLIESIILSVLTVTVYHSIKGIQVGYAIVAASILFGFVVAYAAMFGYDKLISKLKELKR